MNGVLVKAAGLCLKHVTQILMMSIAVTIIIIAVEIPSMSLGAMKLSSQISAE
jgi:hypothetical protein